MLTTYTDRIVRRQLTSRFRRFVGAYCRSRKRLFFINKNSVRKRTVPSNKSVNARVNTKETTMSRNGTPINVIRRCFYVEQYRTSGDVRTFYRVNGGTISRSRPILIRRLVLNVSTPSDRIANFARSTIRAAFHAIIF